MCLPVALESIAHGESKQSLLFTVYFPSFFFQTILISAFLGKFTAQVSRKDSGKATMYLMLLLWPGLRPAFWRRLPPPQMYRRCLHVWLETHPHILPPTGRFPSCFCRSAERISRAHAHSHWAIPLFFPLWNSGWCFSTWGPQAYSWRVMSSTKSFGCSVFTFGSPRWPHQNQLPLHHVKPAFPFRLRSCSWLMNQCAIALKTNASPEFKERKMARELCGLARWWSLQLSSSSHPTCNNMH